jgi:hypothetical protein
VEQLTAEDAELLRVRQDTLEVEAVLRFMVGPPAGRGAGAEWTDMHAGVALLRMARIMHFKRRKIPSEEQKQQARHHAALDVIVPAVAGLLDILPLDQWTQPLFRCVG